MKQTKVYVPQYKKNNIKTKRTTRNGTVLSDRADSPHVGQGSAMSKLQSRDGTPDPYSRKLMTERSVQESQENELAITNATTIIGKNV